MQHLWVLRLGETPAPPRRAEYLQTSGLIRQVCSNWRGSPSAVPWEPFQLNVDNSGRLLRGGRSGIGASRKLGRRNGLGRAHGFGGCWASPPHPTAAEPAPLVPVLTHILLPSASLSTWAGVATTGFGNQVWQQSTGTTWGRAQRSECPTLGERGVALCSDTESLSPRQICGSWSLLLLPGL